MAPFDGMNTTTNTPSAVGGIGSTLATESRASVGLEDFKTIAFTVTSIIGAIVGLATLITLIYKCYKKCRQCAGNGQQPSTPEERIGLNPPNADTENGQQSPKHEAPTESSPLNANTGNGKQPSTPEERRELNPRNADTGNGQQSPTPEEPTASSPLNADTDSVLQKVQEKLQNAYKILFIPKRPDNVASTSIADVDQLYTELGLQLLEATKTPFNENLTTPDSTMPVQKPHKIDSWKDLLNPNKIKELLIILVGRAGFGKTTLFKRIAHTWATSNQLAKFKLLFLIELNKMKTSSIIDAILDKYFLRNERPDRDDLIRIITDNKSETVFLLDGLDELQPSFLEPNLEDDYCLYNVLYKHKQVWQESRVLVATRPHKVADIIEGYQRSVCVETSGFTKENTEQYIRKYFRVDKGKGCELIEIMKTRKSLRQLAHIPVICQIICHIFTFVERQLPDRLAQLYQKFTEFLAQRRCGEDWKQRLESALSVLGRVVLDGLLDNHPPVLTQREFDDCASVLNDASGESGFIQQETIESVDGLTVIVTFLHITFQEYCAACYFANLHHADEAEFHKRLQQINPDNVHAMEYLLRFACGILSGSPATGLILEHVQQQCHEGTRGDAQQLARQLLFESRGSDKMVDKLDRPTDAECDMADKLDRPTEADCDSQEDLLAMRYYLQCLRQPLEELKDFTVYCSSHDELALLRDINDLLRDNNAIRPELHITCRSQEDLTLLRELVLSAGYTRFVAMNQFWVTYIMSEQPTEEVQTLEETLEGMNERLRCRLQLTLEINEMSHFDDYCVLGSRVCNLIRNVNMCNRTYEDVSRLGNALDVRGCDRLRWVEVYDTNLHGHLGVVAPLVPPSLLRLELSSCGLNDDDVPDLIRILPAGHRLGRLTVDGNTFSAHGVVTLTAHLKNLSLYLLVLRYKGADAEPVKQVAKQNLPKVRVF